MTLSEELTWRGFHKQTTYQDVTILDQAPLSFYFGVDPSADSMTIGNLAAAMMVKWFIRGGHQAILLVGGATGLIGDPDGKAEERNLKTIEEIARNKEAIAAQYKTIFKGAEVTIVDNYDWFKDMNYLDFLRLVGKHVPMRQMLSREFVQSRLGEAGNGISYAEFSYSLIQGYDFLHLFQTNGATLQLCGSDQWGNSIAGVDLIRRITGSEAHVWAQPLVMNQVTGKKFGKTESGAVWLDSEKTSPTQFYQFWINGDDDGLETYLKIYTDITKSELVELMTSHATNPGLRRAQKYLARAVTTIVHGIDKTTQAELVTDLLTGAKPMTALDSPTKQLLRVEQPSSTAEVGASIAQSLVDSGLASSLGDARRLLSGNAVAINGAKIARETFQEGDFIDGCLLLRRGKAFKDSAFIELSS